MVARLVLTNYTKTHCMCSQGGTFLQHRATGGQAVDCGIQSNKKNTQKWIDINKVIVVKTHNYMQNLLLELSMDFFYI